MNSHIHERELLVLLFFEGKLDGRMLLVKMLEECTYHVFFSMEKMSSTYLSHSFGGEWKLSKAFFLSRG